MNWAVFLDKTKYHKLFAHFSGNTRLIQELLNLGRHSFLEVGCGSGLTSIALSQLGYDVTCMDNNTEVLERVKRLASAFGVPVKILQIALPSVLKLAGMFDVAFSQGLLEHFTDPNIVATLVNLTYMAKIVLFEVPSKRWPENPNSTETYGDERFLPLKHWKRLIRRAGLKPVKVYGWGFHPKISRLKLLLPPVIWRWLDPYFADNLGFICVKQVKRDEP